MPRESAALQTAPVWTEQFDPGAPAGDVLPPLARLLLELARERLKRRRDAPDESST